MTAPMSSPSIYRCMVLSHDMERWVYVIESGAPWGMTWKAVGSLHGEWWRIESGRTTRNKPKNIGVASCN